MTVEAERAWTMALVHNSVLGVAERYVVCSLVARAWTWRFLNYFLPCHEGAARVSSHARPPMRSNDSILSADEHCSQQLPRHYNTSVEIGRWYLSSISPSAAHVPPQIGRPEHLGMTACRKRHRAVISR